MCDAVGAVEWARECGIEVWGRGVTVTTPGFKLGMLSLGTGGVPTGTAVGMRWSWGMAGLVAVVVALATVRGWGGMVEGAVDFMSGEGDSDVSGWSLGMLAAATA